MMSPWRIAGLLSAVVLLTSSGASDAALLTNFAGSYALYQQCAADAADFDGDGDIEGADFLKWQRGLGLTAQTNNFNGDADHNGVVDAVDMNLWRGKFGMPAVTPDSVCFKLFFDPLGIIEGDVTAVLDVPDPGMGQSRFAIGSENGIIEAHPQYSVNVLSTMLSAPPGRQRLEAKIRFNARNPADPPAGPITIFGYQVHDNLPPLGLADVQVRFEFNPGNFITVFDPGTGQTTTFDHNQLQDVTLPLSVPLLQSGDPVIAIDIDEPTSNSSYPTGNDPRNALDGNPATKYVNFGERNTGFIAVRSSGLPPTPLVPRSMLFVTSDAPPASDPGSWELYGTNDQIQSLDNSDGQAENWTLIASGNLLLPAARGAASQAVNFANSTPYDHFRVVFPQIKDFQSADSMQVAEVLLYDAPFANGNVLNPFFNDDVRAIHFPTAQADSPTMQGPNRILDGNDQTKYVNFGGENAGFIVTPSPNLTTMTSFVITTADDNPARDPASWQLYGTSTPIMSPNFSQGNVENWTLIDEGTLSLPDERLVEGPNVPVRNATPFRSYRMVFPALKNTGGVADAVQFADLQFFGFENLALLTLEVNTLTGAVDLHNATAAPLEISAYEITSAIGLLNPFGWISLDDQEMDPPGVGWEEASGISANMLGEVDQMGSLVLQPGEVRSLGQAFNPAGELMDLQFTFRAAGSPLTQGAIHYYTMGTASAVPEPGALGAAILMWTVAAAAPRRSRRI
jgi:hypothetical protein